MSTQQPAPTQQPLGEAVADRALLERMLVAMEGVIDVADRKTDEFDALRSCVVDLTVALYAQDPHPAPAHQPLTDEQIQDLLCIGNPTEEECRLIRLGWEAANGIGGEKP